ncbi:hypothetical protein AA313_de0200930 [Arthrobotrys entomopaga]|nr:hypothetical protein AA313_de0200930 [Arthrobotrys entomopaga]
MSDDDYHLPPDAEQYVDVETFVQILEMDDDGDREFSLGLVEGFFDQAETTFGDMDAGLNEKDLRQLSGLGHFLKGSSATLGLYKVRDHCEKIQNWGVMKDATGSNTLDKETALKYIAEAIPKMKKDYADAKEWLRRYYEIDPDAQAE